MNNLETIKNIFLRASRAVGREVQLEIFCTTAAGTSVAWSENKLEDSLISESNGIGLRLLKAGRIGFSYTNNFDELSLDYMIASAIQDSEFLNPDGHFAFAAPLPINENLDIFDASFESKSINSKIGLLKDMEAAAMADKRIKSVLRADYAESAGQIFIVNSNGVSLSSRGTAFSYGISCVASDNGEIQTGGEYAVKRKLVELDFSSVTREAVKNAAGLLGAKKINTGNYAAVLNQNVGCEFLSLIASSFSAFSVQKNISLLKGRKKQKVFSDAVNICDDGTLIGGIATSAFDDEGIPTRKTPLVVNGMLENYLYDIYTAGVDNVTSTGNASRGYSGIPAPSPSNIFIAPGSITFEKLLKEMGNGIYITETMGMHNADPVSGEFSVGINGFMVENGEIKHPVHGITIAGNIMNLFNSVAELADDLKFYASAGSPSILINNLSVAGN